MIAGSESEDCSRGLASGRPGFHGPPLRSPVALDAVTVTNQHGAHAMPLNPKLDSDDA